MRWAKNVRIRVYHLRIKHRRRLTGLYPSLIHRWRAKSGETTNRHAAKPSCRRPSRKGAQAAQPPRAHRPGGGFEHAHDGNRFPQHLAGRKLRLHLPQAVLEGKPALLRREAVLRYLLPARHLAIGPKTCGPFARLPLRKFSALLKQAFHVPGTGRARTPVCITVFSAQTPAYPAGTNGPVPSSRRRPRWAGWMALPCCRPGCRHGTGWTGPSSAGNGFAISNTKYRSSRNGI